MRRYHIRVVYMSGGAGGKGVWGKPGSELDETGVCNDIRDPNYDSDSQVCIHYSNRSGTKRM